MSGSLTPSPMPLRPISAASSEVGQRPSSSRDSAYLADLQERLDEVIELQRQRGGDEVLAPIESALRGFISNAEARIVELEQNP